ncbi:hypothetical protein A6P39_006685 [Streptomyces sp. FXJ1.172]|uniref:hypothetical protein n=1 Tax=Streptomyces sp. FXJ1.172 TaxID=710705 RepID=UPI0007D03F02|nr:hypothetical protein [Streptomyces sp. FXJ1.172]WEO93718.1 hypothetical protein A6P39_006685 [Streptomyces sp. FXJ1.172]
MTTCSSSPRPQDALPTSAPAPTGISTPFPHFLTPPAPLPPTPLPEGFQEARQPVRHDAGAADAAGTDSDGEPYRDPLRGLVRSAVAERPLEDVVRLITLLESSPEHARTAADALRAVGLDRPVEDLARLITLLTRPPRGADSADEVIRAAAERRPLEDVTRLIRLLHHTPVEPHCGRTAVQAAAVHRPVEELAELIGRLAADRTALEPGPLPAPAHLEPAEAVPAPGATAAPGTGGQDLRIPDRLTEHRLADDQGANGRPVEEHEGAVGLSFVKDRRVAAAGSVADWSMALGSATDRCMGPGPAVDRAAMDKAAADRAAADRAAVDRAEKDRTMAAGVDRVAADRAAVGKAAAGRAERDRTMAGATVRRAGGTDQPLKDRPAADRSAPDRGRGRRSSRAAVSSARGAALLVLLCGVAHAPRSWAGLPQGILVAGPVASGLCVLLALALALPLRAAQVRLGTVTAALGVGAVLAVGQVLGDRLGLPEQSRLWDMTLAPRWLAGTAAAATALAALVVLLTVRVTGRARRAGAG